MFKTIKICDKCKKEADCLYRVPWLHIKEHDLIIDNGKKELCYNCMTNLCELIFNYHNFTDDYFTDKEDINSKE